ncbi:Uncharacterized protein HZ326_7464 [Fusarium oxysporum f. sp. albedinis]|nr:Uncharacterized protein HZ326_7464 [Fusarium oxysporum f. sp. albedinis]
MFTNARVIVLISASWLCLNFSSESRIRNEIKRETPELLCFFLLQSNVMPRRRLQCISIHYCLTKQIDQIQGLLCSSLWWLPTRLSERRGWVG